MPIAPSHDPDLMIIRSRGRILHTVVALPFLAAGVGILISPFIQKGPLSIFMFFSGGLGLIVIWAALYNIASRTGAFIDRRNGTIVCWYSLYFPMKKTTHSLKNFNLVTLKRPEGNRTNKGYILGLADESIEQTIDVEIYERSYALQRKVARELAKFLNISMMDFTCGRCYKPERLNRIFGQRALKIKIPKLPSGANFQYRFEKNEVHMNLPIPLIDPIFYIFYMLFPFVTAVGVIHKRGNNLTAYIVIGSLAIMLIIYLIVKETTKKMQLHFSSQFFKVTKISAWGKKSRKIESTEIEEIEIIPSSSLLTRNNHEALLVGSVDCKFIVGAGLSRSELKWLFALLYKFYYDENAQK